MNCLAFRNQSHQSHDHRHEQYPLRDEDKREEVRETLHMDSKPYQCIFNVITDHEAQNILSCHQIAVFHMFAIRRCAAFNYCTYSSLFNVFTLPATYQCIHMSFFMPPSFFPSHSARSLPSPCAALQLCESRDSDGRMEGGPEEERG